MSIKQPSDIRLKRQNELEAIIGNPPGWTLVWGMTILFAATALLLLLGFLIRYPDVIEVPVILTTEHPPIRLTANTSARISDFQVMNGSQVEAGELLGSLDNPAHTEDIFQLEQFILSLEKNDLNNALVVSIPTGLQLGDIQEAFTLFQQRFSELQYFLNQDIRSRKISNLRSQIAALEKLNTSLKRQNGILEKEVALYARNVSRDSILFHRNALSEMEYEQSQATYLARLRELESGKSQQTGNDLLIQQKQALILDIQGNQSDDQKDQFLAVRTAIRNLKSAIEFWKRTWLLVSPISGEVFLTRAWSEQQFVREGEEVLTIVPLEKSGQIMGKARLSGPGSGKVSEEMEALLRLDGFPFQEFGVVPGKITRISRVPGEDGYDVDISVDSPLTTSYQRSIPFRQEMKGQARIVLEDRSLLTRILEKITAAFQT